jgi:hypothetical protein
MADKTAPKTKVPGNRDARLKTALKANLARRKGQAKAREAAAKSEEQDDG